MSKNKLHHPRPIEQIRDEYNRVCAKDEQVIDLMLEMGNKIPKALMDKHLFNLKLLRWLDNERNYSIPFYHNVYRLHYAQTYPKQLNSSLVKQSHQ